MSNRPSDALIGEAAGWIAEQLIDEGVLVDAELVELLLNFEWDGLESGVNPDDRAALVAAVCERTAASGVRVGSTPETMPQHDRSPETEDVPSDLVDRVLSWEDDFLALARIKRG